MTRPLFLCFLVFLFSSFQAAMASPEFEELLARNAKLIHKSSSKTVDPVLAEIQEFGGQAAAEFMETWKDKKLYYVKKTGQFVLAEPAGKNLSLIHI